MKHSPQNPIDPPMTTDDNTNTNEKKENNVQVETIAPPTDIKVCLFRKVFTYTCMTHSFFSSLLKHVPRYYFGIQTYIPAAEMNPPCGSLNTCFDL